MGFFTVGNLITLGIVLLILILFRHMDRNNRNLKLLRDYSDKLKKELSSYMEEQEKAVKDYGVSLNVERESAKELMKRLQMTDEELAEKAAAVERLDAQIASCEKSVSELDRMTGRVQENMNRVREESAFVENAGKRVFEAKSRVEELEKQLGSLEERFRNENSASLEKTAEAVVLSVKSTVSDLDAAAQDIGFRVENHRKEIAKIEEVRAVNMARDLDRVDKILSKAVEQAAGRADKMEEAALVHLKEKAEDRMQKLKNAEEEKLRSYQESAKERVAEVQNLARSIREEWRVEKSDLEAKDKVYREDRERKILELNTRFVDAEKHISENMGMLAKRMEDLAARAEGLVSSQEALLLRAAEEMKQKALEATGAKLEEYRHVQNHEFKRLEALADDSRKLDTELRRNMDEVVARVREDLSRYEQESENKRRDEAQKFSMATSDLRMEVDEVGKNLQILKQTAYDNVSDKMKIFEDEFFADLAKRSGDIDKRLSDWQEEIETRFSDIKEGAEKSRMELERSLAEELRKKLSSQDDRIILELERLKAEAGAFEEGIRSQMSAAGDSVALFKERLDRSFEDAKEEADIFIKSEISKHSIETAENVKKYQRELDEARSGFAVKIREIEDSVEDSRNRVRELLSETDSRIVLVRASVEDTERHIREAVDQTKLIDRAEALKLDVERSIEDLKGDMDRIDQRRTEAIQLENEFTKIRRLGDDVNAKMTRYISEEHRIKTIEENLNRTLQVSRAVEDKLNQVTNSDDVLQGVQLQIRKLEESLGRTEEKYQRMEKKNQVLDNTNDGIDRNFKVLQDSEKISEKIGAELDRYASDLDTIKISIVKLADESEKARAAADRIDVLDEALEQIEERIKSMQRARQWIAEAETRLEELNRQALIQARAIEGMLKGKKPIVIEPGGEGAPSIQKRENIINLILQGWRDEEIAKAMKCSIGEVQLVRETVPKG